MASLPLDRDPFEELEARAARMGMEPKVFLAWLLDAEKRELLLQLEQSAAEMREGRGRSASEVLDELRQKVRDHFAEA